MRGQSALPVLLLCAALLLVEGCGGGVTSLQNSTPPPPPPPKLSIASTSVPGVVQDQSYNFTFQASGGTPPLAWSSLDPLPAGLTLSSAGVLSGNPTTRGSYYFRVQVQDSGTPVQTASTPESLFVVGTLSLSSVTFPNANRGIGYQFGFFPTGGSAPFNFSVTVGSLPSGMSISSYGSTAGQLSGTPTQAGNFPFTLQVTDSGQGSIQQTASAQMQVHVDAILKITTINIPSGVQNRPYTGGLTAVNGILPLHWSMPFVPQGLAFDATTGTFTGTPTQSVASSFAVSVTDSSSPPQSDIASVVWFIYGTLQFLQTDLGSMQQGYFGALFPIYFSGGQPPVTSRLISGSLPQGMYLDTIANFLGGLASQPGHYSVGVQLQDSAMPPQTAQATLTFIITPQFPVLANSTFPGGVLGIPYSWGVTAKNGQPPLSWNIRSGSLPPGLTLDSLGLISGTPTAAGTYPFTLQVTDSFSPPDTTWSNVAIVVSPHPLGRNDSVATATPLTNGTYAATNSPYSDPSTNAADGDYYRLTANPGSIVSISVFARRIASLNPLDSVLEIVDASGARFVTCKDPASAFLSPPLAPDPDPTDYNDPCINDDDPNTGTTDSDLSFQVPGTPGGQPVVLYLHVLDWRGDARPDMEYQIQISGAN
jgi:putative Ig domain-containing protein